MTGASESVAVPGEVSAWKSSEADRAKARAVQEANASALEAAFARGLAVVGYTRNVDGAGQFLLEAWSEPEPYPGGVADED